MDRTTLTLTIDLQLDDGAFTGNARDDRGAGRDFSGWLGLIAALDELLDTAPARIREASTETTQGPEDAPC